MAEDCAGSPELVRDLMTLGVVTCLPQTQVIDIARLFLEQALEAIVVLDPEEGQALGVVSQDELVQAYTLPEFQSLKAEDIMREDVLQVPPDIPLVAAAQLMRDRGVRVLYLMHHAGGVVYPAAMISYQHILRHLATRNQDELRDLGIYAERELPIQTFMQRRDAARSRNQSS